MSPVPQPYDPEVSGDRRRRPVASAWLAPAFVVGSIITGAGFVWNVATSASDLKHVTDRVEEQRKYFDERRADDLKKLADQTQDLRRDMESRRRDDDTFNSKRTDYLQALDARVAKLENQIYYLVLNKPEPRK